MATRVAAVAVSQILVQVSSLKCRLTFLMSKYYLYLYKKTDMHLTLTPAQAAKIAQMGSTMKGKGLIPENFDEDDFQDHSIVDFPVYVSKGRGQYAGHGGGMTSLLKLLYTKMAGNPEVRKLAKKAVKAGVKQGADLASSEMKKRGVKNPMADVAINMASKRANDEIDKHLKGGRRIRANGVGTSGIRISGSGHCGMGLMAAGHRGRGLRAP